MAETREFQEVEYGVVAIVPDGTWEPGKQYEIGRLVDYDGSSYVANKKPPVGTLPTDKNYWQTSAQGASKATSETLGVVKPDNLTTEVDENAMMSVKTATQSTKGIVKGSDGIKVGNDGSIDVDTTFTQATQLANLIAGEAISEVLGKVSKSIAITMGLNQNALLKNMISNIDVNDPSKIPSSALSYLHSQRIGMGENLNVGTNLTNGLNKLNSDSVNRGLYNGDLNNIPLPRPDMVNIYVTSSTSPNIPISTFGEIKTVHVGSASYAIQEFLSLDSVPRRFVRSMFDGTWGEWTEK